MGSVISINKGYISVKKTEKEGLWEKDLWTQSEVASYFSVTPNTIKNWRQSGLLSYFKAPGSSRVLYYSQEIRDFQKQHTRLRKEAHRQREKPVRVKPKLSSDEDWRIS